MEENVASCIIHFDDVSNGVLREFTSVTLSKFIHSRKIWLSLTGAQTDVAVKSLEYFTDRDEELFTNEETIPEGLQYHIECYRKFTDKTKIESLSQDSQEEDAPEIPSTSRKVKMRDNLELFFMLLCFFKVKLRIVPISIKVGHHPLLFSLQRKLQKWFHLP